MRCARCPAPTLLPAAVPAVTAYSLVRTQWRIGPAGITGLDYTACIATWDAWRARVRLPATDRLLRDVAVIESALLQADRERAERTRGARDGETIGEGDASEG